MGEIEDREDRNRKLRLKIARQLLEKSWSWRALPKEEQDLLVRRLARSLEA